MLLCLHVFIIRSFMAPTYVRKYAVYIDTQNYCHMLVTILVYHDKILITNIDNIAEH